MSYTNDILNELHELSPALAAIPRGNVFTVPEGYFDHLSSEILLHTVDQSIANSVPVGYFDTLSDNIMARIKQENSEEAAISSTLLAGIGNKNIYTVPDNYFNELAGNIISNIRNTEEALETEAVSELLASIGNKNVFTVPEGYFDELPAAITKQISSAKVVTIPRRSKFWNYAAAAVVTGIIALSAVFVFNKTDKSALSAEELAAIESAQNIIKTNSFEKEIASLNDADIVNFLESKGQDVDAALVASLTEDEKILPDAEAYLFDEDALNELLKNLDLNN